MKDDDRTKQELISELRALRRRVEELESESRFRTLVERLPETVSYIYQGTNEEITRRKELETMLHEKEKELEAKSLELEEINTALRVLIKRRQEDQQEFAASVLANLKELVFPYLEKLKQSALNDLQRTFLKVVQSHLEEISAPFLRKLSREFTGLSRTERQIASLIKEGKRNKEISAMLGVSVNTILTHRYHLRTKLGLKNKKINLISYLKSIDIR